MKSVAPGMKVLVLVLVLVASLDPASSALAQPPATNSQLTPSSRPPPSQPPPPRPPPPRLPTYEPPTAYGSSSPVLASEKPPPAPSLYAGAGFKITGHLSPVSQDQGGTQPISPFGKFGIAAEFSPMPWFAVEAGIGHRDGMQIAAVAHARIPLVRWAFGVGVGIQRGAYLGATGRGFDCEQQIFGVHCEYAARYFDPATWLLFAGELEYRNPRLRKIAFRLSIGAAKLFNPNSFRISCSSSDSATCAQNAEDVEIAPTFTFSAGYLFGN